MLLLSEAFLADLGRSLGRPPAGISTCARDVLLAHDWPGNVRELRNALERAAILCDGGLITASHLSLRSRPAPRDTAAAISPTHPPSSRDVNPPATQDLRTLEREVVRQALTDARFNKTKAARALGLTRTQLYVRLRRHGLV